MWKEQHCMRQSLRTVLKILTVENLAAFHPSRPWGRTTNNKTLTMVLQIGVGMPGSLELFEAFNGLSNSSVFQLVDASLRVDAAKHSPLADQVQRHNERSTYLQANPIVCENRPPKLVPNQVYTRMLARC